jgi:hypothetical protein
MKNAETTLARKIGCVTLARLQRNVVSKTLLTRIFQVSCAFGDQVWLKRFRCYGTAEVEPCARGRDPLKKWRHYLSERQWGTVREAYSESGDAWNYFTHDQSRSRTYRWGEDGLGGLCDDKQRLCFALALWNERDPILKERPFGLTNGEGNHGEDVKEYYFYLDSTPTHSYMKYLYKYPQREYPCRDLVETNRRRSREEPEYELLDTGVFADDRYFDVFVEYAKESPEDVLIRILCIIAGRKRPGCVCCRHSGFATPGPGVRTIASLRCAKWRLASFRPRTMIWESTG